MHAKILFDGVTGGSLSYTDIFDDMIDVICGETDYANLAAGEQGAEGSISSTVAAGWTLVSRDDTTTSGQIYYILSAPVAGASTKLKYVLFRCNTSTGQFYWIYADAIASGGTSTTELHHTKSSEDVSYSQGGSNYVYNSVSYYLYLSVTPQCIGIMVGYSSAYSTFMFEYDYDQTNFLRTIGKDEDFCPICSYDGTGIVSHPSVFLPIPSPISDDPDEYFVVRANSDGLVDGGRTSGGDLRGYIGILDMWTGYLAPAQVLQNDDTEPYAFYKPWAGSGRVILGPMHSNVPWYRVDSSGSPSIVPGDEVSITPIGGGPARTFVVWAHQWGATTSIPLYVEKI